MPYASDAQMYMASWDGRHFDSPDYSAQVREHHIIQSLHISSPSLEPDLPHPFTTDLTLHDPTMLGFETPATRFHPHALTPATDYTFGLPQSRVPDPHYHTPHDVLHDPPAGYSSHHQVSMPASNHTSPTTAQPPKTTQPSATATAGRQPRREASNVVIACRQW